MSTLAFDLTPPFPTLNHLFRGPHGSGGGEFNRVKYFETKFLVEQESLEPFMQAIKAELQKTIETCGGRVTSSLILTKDEIRKRYQSRGKRIIYFNPNSSDYVVDELSGFRLDYKFGSTSGEVFASVELLESPSSLPMMYMCIYIDEASQNGQQRIAQKPNEITNSTGEKVAPKATSNSTDEKKVLESVTNSIGMKLVLIPKGTFQMGSPIDDPWRPLWRGVEEQHQVTISKDYFLGVTEVTQGQYEKVMGTNPSLFQKQEIGKSDSSMYPVEGVSWDDVVEFCKRLSELPEEKTAGRVYRLPTEAEWEYACRAGSTTAFSFGDRPNRLPDYAWIGGNSNAQTHPVGEKKPNAWGLYDMHGNVWEWCSDWYGEYPKGAISDPTGPKEGSDRVYRGGSWYFSAAICRSARRDAAVPSARDVYYGFRVALSSSGIPK